MKTTENKTARFEIRLSDDDLRFFKIASYINGQTASQMVRMFIDSIIIGLKTKINRGEIKYEDIEAICND